MAWLIVCGLTALFLFLGGITLAVGRVRRYRKKAEDRRNDIREQLEEWSRDPARDNGQRGQAGPSPR